MNLNREQFLQLSTWIFTTRVLDELKFLYGNAATSYGSVKNWLNEFNCGRRSLKDEVPEGPLKTMQRNPTKVVCGKITSKWSQRKRSRVVKSEHLFIIGLDS